MQTARITQNGYEALQKWLWENHRHNCLNVDAFASEAEEKWCEGESCLVVELTAHESRSGAVVSFSPEFEVIELTDED